MAADSVVAAAMAAAATAGVTSFAVQDNDDNFSATKSLVAYLRMEADLADEKAKKLRAQAAELARKFGITDAQQEAYGTYGFLLLLHGRLMPSVLLMIFFLPHVANQSLCV